MSRCINNLESILHTDSIVKRDVNGTATLEEHSDKNNKYKVTLTSLPTNILLVKTDRFEDTKHFLSSQNGIRKRSDYAVIEEDKIIFIELASSGGARSSKTDTDIARQFNGARCVMDYCASIGKHFKNDSNFISQCLKKQYFILLRHRKNAAVRPTNHNQQKKNRGGNGNTPKNHKKIDFKDSIPYKKILEV